MDVWASSLERGDGWLCAVGPVVLPTQPGGIQTGDRGRVFVAIDTPSGGFGVPGLDLRLERAPDGVRIADVRTLDALTNPVKQCG